jgi:adenylate cyclase
MTPAPTSKIMLPDNTEESAPWAELHRERRALVVVDVVESVRLMQQYEDDVIRRWVRFVHEVRNHLLPKHGGRMVKSLGDGMLLEFAEVRAAPRAAFAMLRLIQQHNVPCHERARIALRVGIHAADVVVEDHDIYGAGVNLTARLATLARPGDVIVSADVADFLIDGIDGYIEDLGDCHLKNVEKPVRALRLSADVGTPQSVAVGAPALGGYEQWDQVGIAVLTIDNLGVTDSGFALGCLVADELATTLSTQPGLRVISRLSTPPLKASGRDISSLGSALGAAYLVTGRLRTQGDSLQLTLELADRSNGGIALTQSFRCSIGAILEGEDAGLADAAQKITEIVARFEVRRAMNSPLPNLESHSILIGALHLMHRLSAQDYQRAYEMLSYLVERHPRSITAKAWLAKWHVLRAPQGWSENPKSDASRAQQLTREALDRDPSHALSLAVEGFALGYFMKDHDGAMRRYDEALRWNPSESLAWLFRSAILSYRGETDQAIDSAMRAQRSSPLDPLKYFYDHFTSGAYLAAGQYEQAIFFGERSRRANRMHASNLRVLAIAQVLGGRLDAGRETVGQLLGIEPALTASSFRARFPGKDEAQVDVFCDALRLAGVPD